MGWEDLPMFLTREEAADLLRVSPKTLARRAENGEIAYTTVGRRKLFFRDDLRELIYRNYRK